MVMLWLGFLGGAFTASAIRSAIRKDGYWQADAICAVSSFAVAVVLWVVFS